MNSCSHRNIPVAPFVLVRTVGLLALVGALTGLMACSGADETTGSGGSSGSGGAGSGGNGSGGTTSSTGGSGSGGAASGGSASGGSSTGGSSTGGSASGGSSSGGSASGGSSTGGSASGGAATGGSSSGGASGGSASGGAAGHAMGGGMGGAAVSTGGSGPGGNNGGTYNPCPATDPCKVLPLGDSITYGLITVAADKSSSDSSINGKDSHGGYRVKLFSSAVMAGQKLTFTGGASNGPDMVAGMTFPKSHSGYSGYTIDNTTGTGINTTAVLDPAFKTLPDIILLHIGTNDVYSSKGMQAGMADRLAKLLDELAKRAPKALIVVATITPLGGSTGSSSNTMTIATYNGKIPDVVAQQVTAGHHVVMVDIFKGFDATKFLSGDGVHPNQMGYDYMGSTFYGAISALLPK